MSEPQTAATVLMVRPAAFSFNEQTAPSNCFQLGGGDSSATQSAALREFDAAVRLLRRAGVEVLLLEDSPEPQKPDAIFPNNWFSTHADGSLVLYPLLAPNRRLERRDDLVDCLREHGFLLDNLVDLTALESSDSYLEGTGSLTLDRVHRIAYAALSPRTTPVALQMLSARLGYWVLPFDTADAHGQPIYHTNVMLSIGRRFAAVCLEAVSVADRGALRASLLSNDREVIELSVDQITSFAGNMLELAGCDDPCVALSTTALDSLTARQRSTLERLGGQLVAADLSTIEKHGGGSFRCMLAEIHLPRRGVVR